MADPVSPRVSVILPLYNGLPHLLDVSESVLAQTYDDFELLLIDDGSTDGSGPACDAFAERDGRVRVLRHPGGVNRGLVASLNLGLAEARGDLIARVDADDRSYPDRFAKQVAFLDANPDVGVVGSQADSFDGESWTVWVKWFTPELIRWELLFTTPMMHSSVIMRREVPERVGGYDARYEYSEDYKFFYEASKVTRIANLPEPLIEYKRDIASSISRTHRERQFVNYRAIQREVHRDYGLGYDISDVTSAYLFCGWMPEVERFFGPVGLREAETIARSLRDLRRMFMQKWTLSDEDRRSIEDYTYWYLSGLAYYIAGDKTGSRLLTPLLRLKWSPQSEMRYIVTRLYSLARRRAPRHSATRP